MQYVIGVDSFEYQFWPKLFLEEVYNSMHNVSMEFQL